MDRKALEKMLEQGNDSAMLRYTLGALLMKEGLQEEAIGHLREALAQNPAHSASWKLYAKALGAEGRVDEAASAYEEGIQVAEARGDVQSAKEMKVFLKRLRQG